MHHFSIVYNAHMVAVPADDWWLSKRNWQPVLYILCPECGIRAELQHVIRPGGKVEPSVDCPDCNFHEHITLEGWGDVELDFGG